MPIENRSKTEMATGGLLGWKTSLSAGVVQGQRGGAEERGKGRGTALTLQCARCPADQSVAYLTP
ncbi:hypothetical protein GCM10010273_59410 [Streptomyces lavendulocolor]